jgi:lipopolysaccharide/colanic/teichoic acid biosynthesis glycosyltransferase
VTIIPIFLEQRRRRALIAFPTPGDVLHRVFNVAIALVGLLLALPLMIVIAVAVKLTSPGPVFFRQTRIGINRRRLLGPGARYRPEDRGGRPFTMFKFRTMVAAESGAAAAQVWATPDDPRVTRLGRILRLYRLDELPQLINVLLGNMSIVGPRPEQPTIFTHLRQEIDLYQARQCVPPGITGWAQINQHYDSSIEDVKKKLAFDLEYIRRRSVVEDLRIMLRTIPTMVGKVGGW